MPKAFVYDMTGAQIGEMELPVSVFGIEPNAVAIHEAVKNQLANRRQGTQSALTRAEVSGGGIKPWRQKGTGRARQGSTRAPQWTHGGVVFAPKPRSYSYVLNRKYKRLALLSALSMKAAEAQIIVVDDLKVESCKTKDFAKFLKAVGADTKSLVVTESVKEDVVRSAKNIAGVKTTIATTLNVYDIVAGDKFIVDRAAIAKIEEVFGK